MFLHHVGKRESALFFLLASVFSHRVFMAEVLMRSTRIMGLFAFGQFTEHEKRGCVGNASRAETVFRLELLLYSFVEDTFTQERGSRRWISAVLLVLLFLLHTCSKYLILIFTESIFFQQFSAISSLFLAMGSDFVKSEVIGPPLRAWWCCSIR